MNKRRAMWVALLDAAQDQPHPTIALKRVVEQLLLRDPAALDTPDRGMGDDVMIKGALLPPDGVDRIMDALAAKRARKATPVQERRRTRAERFLTGLADIQDDDDDV